MLVRESAEILENKVGEGSGKLAGRTAHNAAQSEEKYRFILLLSDLCCSVSQPEQAHVRRRLLFSNVGFAAVLKT